MTDQLIERLRALHVWPQVVADYHAEVITPQQIAKLYEVGFVSHEAADRIEALQQRGRELEEALRPFAFLEMEKDEGLADTQYVWEVIYQDRVQDWIAYEHIAAARKALGDTHD